MKTAINIVHQLRKCVAKIIGTSSKTKRQKQYQEQLNAAIYLSFPSHNVCYTSVASYCAAMGLSFDTMKGKHIENAIWVREVSLQEKYEAEMKAMDGEFYVDEEKGEEHRFQDAINPTEKKKASKFNMQQVHMHMHREYSENTYRNRRYKVWCPIEEKFVYHAEHAQTDPLITMHAKFLTSPEYELFLEDNKDNPMVKLQLLQGKVGISCQTYASCKCPCIKYDRNWKACADTIKMDFLFALDAYKKLLDRDIKKNRGNCENNRCLCHEAEYRECHKDPQSAFNFYNCKSRRTFWTPCDKVDYDHDVQEAKNVTEANNTSVVKQARNKASIKQEKPILIRERKKYQPLVHRALSLPNFLCADSQCKDCSERAYTSCTFNMSEEEHVKVNTYENMKYETLKGKEVELMTLVEVQMTRTKFIVHFNKILRKYLTHSWKCQLDDYDTYLCTRYYPKDTLVFSMDFAANYSCEGKYSPTCSGAENACLLIICAHFGRDGIPRDKKYVQQNIHYTYIMQKTQEVKDESSTVTQLVMHFLEDIYKIAKDLGYNLCFVIEKTDNCGKQFKCRFYFYDSAFMLNKLFAKGAKYFTLSHQFFTSMNGKGEHDGVGGWVKAKLRSAELTDKERMNTPWKCFKFLHDMDMDVLQPIPFSKDQPRAYHAVNQRKFFFAIEDIYESNMVDKLEDPHWENYKNSVVFVSGKTSAKNKDPKKLPVNGTKPIHELIYYRQLPGQAFYRHCHCSCIECLKHKYHLCKNLLNDAENSEYQHPESLGHMFTSHNFDDLVPLSAEEGDVNPLTTFIIDIEAREKAREAKEKEIRRADKAAAAAEAEAKKAEAQVVKKSLESLERTAKRKINDANIYEENTGRARYKGRGPGFGAWRKEGGLTQTQPDH